MLGHSSRWACLQEAQKRQSLAGPQVRHKHVHVTVVIYPAVQPLLVFGRESGKTSQPQGNALFDV